MDATNAPTEDTALLTAQSEHRLGRRVRKTSPLPWPQLSIVLFAKACDTLATQSIRPYITQVSTIYVPSETTSPGLLLMFFLGG